MKKFSVLGLAVPFILLFCLDSVHSKELISTTENQKEIALTVYNSNLGLVKEIREISIPRGSVELKFMDVASQIKPTTVLVKSLNHPNSFDLLEQNYEYDLLSPEKLLQKYVGEKLKVVFRNSTNLAEKEVDATLLSANQGYIFQVGKEIRIDKPDSYILPRIPENLISKPTLVWLIDSSAQQSHQIEASYLTNGINWSADYVALLNKDDSSCDLSGWVTVNNSSGAIYKNAKLKLVAGDINRVSEDRDMSFALSEMAAAPRAMKKEAFKEEGLFEYHMYTLDGRTTVKNNETKQITLLNVSSIPVKKEFLYFGNSSYFRSSYGYTMENQKIGTYVEIDNTKKNKLGIPLPKGILRAYKADSEGNLQFIGEDSIDHTPKDEKFKIKLGDAFDIVGERKQTEYRAISDRKYSVAWQITVKNHKEEDIAVGVVEPIWGDWKVIEKSHPFTKVDARTLRFDIKVPKNGKTDLTYKVEVKW
jgi:hypothetical protein